MNNIDKIFQKESITDLNTYIKSSNIDETYFNLALCDFIRKNGGNEFFSHALNFIHTTATNDTLNTFIELAIDYSDRTKYDIIKGVINDKDFYKRPPCNLYCFYKPEFLSEFKPLLQVKDNKFEHLLVFVLNHTKSIYPEVMNAIINKITPEQSHRLIGEAIANSIIFNHPQGMQYFLEKSEQLDCWNQVQIYLESGLKQKGPANLRYEPKYKNCEDISKLLQYLKEARYDGAQYYQDTVSRLNFYYKLEDNLENKPQQRKMKI